MKRFVTFFLFAVFMTVPVFSMTSTIDDEEDPEEIPIGQNQNGYGPTSVGGVSVQAWLTTSSIYVDIYNYTGYAMVMITGVEGVVGPVQSQISGAGQICLDITSLPEGFYTIVIQAGSTFTGCFRL